MPDGAPDVFNQQPGQIAAHSETSDDSLHDEIAPVGGHWIRRNLPTSDAQPVCKVV
jgi:hypothetical protein